MPDSLKKDSAPFRWLPDLLYADGRFESNVALLCDADGLIAGLESATVAAAKDVRLRGLAVLPGLVNAHSHAFQRVIRGRTERRTGGHDSFWTWREAMYSAASRLTPDDIYDASRMAFLEMALGGITTVGEFHYLHRTPEGVPYDDPNLLAKAVIRAARDVGLRIALLRVAYARSGYGVEPNERQKRFIEAEPETYLRNMDALRVELAHDDSKTAWAGVAPHSVRAVPLAYLREVKEYAARQRDIPLHMHVAEQPAEISACLEEYGRTPVRLLDSEGLLTSNFTGVHAIHISSEEAGQLARASAFVCACPTTERNLGDGIVPADMLLAEGVRVSLGTDSHTQIDLLEDARELEYHLRLRSMERAVLAPADDGLSSLAARLFDCATIDGARSINAPGGKLAPGFAGDFFTIDLNDPSIAGASADDLLSHVVFGLARSAIKDVFVGGRRIVSDGRHEAQQEIVERFGALQKRLWG
ncbi:MAG TPA: formimidoylglutamate deiminase [Pyrinomonadaceae bacterium]|nr:formimidoylglutamate deiminase [Pyrinomonadaceae bacterium]